MVWYSNINDGFKPLLGPNPSPPQQSSFNNVQSHTQNSSQNNLSPISQLNSQQEQLGKVTQVKNPNLPQVGAEHYSSQFAPLTTVHNPNPITAAPRMEDSIEFKMAQDNTKREVGIYGGLDLKHAAGIVRPMDRCEDYRVHLRNCADCRSYMNSLLTTERPLQESNNGGRQSITEHFGNMSSTSIDTIVLIAIGILLIFMIDALLKFSLSIRRG